MEIAKFGKTILQAETQPLKFPISCGDKQFFSEFFDFFTENNWAGLAAPQVSKNLRAFVFQAPQSRCEGDEEPIEPTLVINPDIISVGDYLGTGLERCLSFPDVIGEVSRPQKIEYTYLNIDGEQISRKADGFHSRVFQHEFDHLNGVLFAERMTQNNRFFDSDTKREIPRNDVISKLKKMGISLGLKSYSLGTAKR